MDHLLLINTGKLTGLQKNIYRKFAELLNSTNNIILLYWSNGKSTEYDKIYYNLVEKNRLGVTITRVHVNNIEDYKFLDINNVPCFTFYQKKKKIAQVNGKNITEKVLQSYIKNIMYHREDMGIKE
jgi:hypothetical protein